MSAPVKVGQQFTVRGTEHRVLRITRGRVLIENTATTETREVDSDELLELYAQGDLLIANSPETQPIQLGGTPNAKEVDMARLGEKGRKETINRSHWLAALERLRAFRTRSELKRAIPKVAAELESSRTPGVSTLYRWRRRWLQSKHDPRSLMARFDQRGGRNKYRMDPEVEAMLAKCADEIYLGQRRASAGEVHRAVELAVSKANAGRIPSQHLRAPSLRTVQTRMARLYAFDIAIARQGARIAKAMYGDSVSARPASRILEVVEIDHTPVDLWIVDADGVLLGRPTLTVLLDRFSRCVLGFFLSLTGHGVDAVFAAIRHALLPKIYIRKRYAEVQGTWPCYGKWTTLLADNGSELAGKSLEHACFDLGINLEFCGSMTPNDKPHIERFFYTLNHRFIHTLKGTSLNRVATRGGERLENDACLTLGELERLIHVWIVDVYHARPHAGLEGRTPADVWTESAERFPPSLTLSVAQIDVALSEVGESSLGRGGININNNRYTSERLCALRRMLPQASKVKIKFRRGDVGSILVFDDFSEEYFQVPNVKPERNGLSVEQDEAVRNARKAASSHDSLRVASAEAILRERTNQLHASRKIRDHHKASRLSRVNSDLVRRPPKPELKGPTKPEVVAGLYNGAPRKIASAPRSPKA